jgi:uncharacterized membrane protein
MGKKHPEKPQSNQDTLPELPQEVVTILKEMPEPKRKVIMRAFSLSISQHQGPLPDGETIKIYNEQIPNGGDRIMTSFESQLEHRFDLEKTGVRRSFNQSSTGQWMAFGIAIFFGLISWDLAKSGHDTISGILGGIDIIGLVTVFIIGRSKQK